MIDIFAFSHRAGLQIVRLGMVVALTALAIPSSAQDASINGVLARWAVIANMRSGSMGMDAAYVEGNRLFLKKVAHSCFGSLDVADYAALDFKRTKAEPMDSYRLSFVTIRCKEGKKCVMSTSGSHAVPETRQLCSLPREIPTQERHDSLDLSAIPDREAEAIASALRRY